MNQEVSIIIRTKNEQRYLPEVLNILHSQTYQNFEIIIIDDNSTDKTLDIAKEYNCRIVKLGKNKFSHPYSCNLGVQAALGRFVVFLNGHSLPISNTWLADGLKFFSNSKVAGVYALTLAHKDGTIVDKILLNTWVYIFGLFRYKASKYSMALLATTNCIIRKDLLVKMPFVSNINGGWGGEDCDWARKQMELGYEFIHDPKFRVRHSHHIKMKDAFWQLRNWLRMFLKFTNDPEKQRRNF